jgi:hypothetical protein
MRRNRFPLDDDRIQSKVHLRRTFATLAHELHLTIGERKALMGHSRAEQTLAYTHMHSDKAVAALERFDAMLGQFDGAKWPVN